MTVVYNQKYWMDKMEEANQRAYEFYEKAESIAPSYYDTLEWRAKNLQDARRWETKATEYAQRCQSSSPLAWVRKKDGKGYEIASDADVRLAEQEESNEEEEKEEEEKDQDKEPKKNQALSEKEQLILRLEDTEDLLAKAKRKQERLKRKYAKNKRRGLYTADVTANLSETRSDIRRLKKELKRLDELYDTLNESKATKNFKHDPKSSSEVSAAPVPIVAPPKKNILKKKRWSLPENFSHLGNGLVKGPFRSLVAY